jgi:Polyketide cyclase / dehydrase and lipid transport
VSPIIATLPASEIDWGATGSTRRVYFHDGTVALERILSTALPFSYSYQIWGFASPVRLISDHAVSTITAIDRGGGTHVVWDYGFHARSASFRPFLALFMRLDWTSAMRNGLDILKTHLEMHGLSMHIHEVPRRQRDGLFDLDAA